MIAGGLSSRASRYTEYPQFRKEWWAYRKTYHSHVQDELASRVLKEKSRVWNAWSMVNDIEDLQEIWETFDTCYDRPKKYIAEALELIVKFRRYRAFKNGAVPGGSQKGGTTAPSHQGPDPTQHNGPNATE
jgi:hypothetical protein